MIKKSFILMVLLAYIGQSALAMDMDEELPDSFEQALKQFSSLDVGLFLFINGSKVPPRMGLLRFAGENGTNNFTYLPDEIFKTILCHLRSWEVAPLILVDRSCYRKIEKFKKTSASLPEKEEWIHDAAFHLNHFSDLYLNDSRAYETDTVWFNHLENSLEQYLKPFNKEEDLICESLDLAKAVRLYDEEFISKNFIEIFVVADNKWLLILSAQELLKKKQWRRDFCSFAAKHGKLDLLIYAKKKGFPWDELPRYTWVAQDPRWSKYAEEAAQHGNLSCLKFLCQQFFYNDMKGIGQSLLTAAVNGGDVKCVKYIHEKGVPLLESHSHCAAEDGNLEVLKYLMAQGLKNVNICSFAASKGHLHILRYAHENGCPWNEHTCLCAAKGGHLDCLIYAHENDCPWNEGTCSLAALYGHLDCLIYAHKNDCPWDGTTCSLAAGKRHFDCLTYAFEHGCPRVKLSPEEASKSLSHYEYPPSSGNFYSCKNADDN